MIFETGLRYGDLCTLVSPITPRKKIPLNRTQWDIVPEGDLGIPGTPKIYIPGVKPRTFHWRLLLENIHGKDQFLLRSQDGTPFAVNGQWGREAFIESRDTLSVDGLTRLEFSREQRIESFDKISWPLALADEKVLRSRLSILLEGETGTGKSHLAKEIHKRSGRTGQFVALNLAALSPGLIEAELFGHKKGAFTGAIKDRMGALGLAKGGTLFLDEIDSLSHELQIKLLLFLDHGNYRPVGGEQEEKTDARMIFASGKKLENLVSSNHMRSDFYFRISHGVKVEMKPLRFSHEEIIRQCNTYCVENDVCLSPRLLDFYKTLPWPGNIRQLRGHLQSKKIRSKTRKLDFDGSDEALLTMSSDLMGLSESKTIRPIEDIKRDYARNAYKLCQSELYRTARELQVNPKTLRGWLAS